MTRGRTRHNRRAAAENTAALTSALAAIGNAGAARPMADPALSLAPYSGGNPRGGSVAGITPMVLGQALAGYAAGDFAPAAAIWDQLERRDDTIQTAREKRFRKVKRELRNYAIEPVDESALAQRHAEFLRQLYRHLRAENALEADVAGGLPMAAEFAMDAVSKGYSFLAKEWRYEGGELRLTLRHVPLWHFSRSDRRFRFNPGGAAQAAPIDPAQWLVAAQRCAKMEPGSVLALYKRLPMKQWVHFLEKFGVPNVHGETDAAVNSPEWAALYQAVAAYRSGMVAVMSKGDSLVVDELKFAAGRHHQPWIQFCNDALTILYVGGALSTWSTPGTGTLAGGAQADDTDDIIAADCDWLSETFNAQIDAPAIRYEFGDAEPLARFVCEKPDPTDDVVDLRVLRGSVELGARVPVDYIHDRFNLPQAAEGDEILALVNIYEDSADTADTADQSDQSDPTDPTDQAANARQNPRSGAANARQNPRSGAANARPVHFRVVRAGNAKPLQTPRGRAANAQQNPRSGQTPRSGLDDLAELETNSLGPVRAAYAALFAPLVDGVAAAPNLTAAESIASAYAAPADATEAFAETMAQVVFAAAMRGYVADPAVASAVGNAQSAPGWISRAWSAARRALGNAEPAEVEFAPLPFDEAEAFWAGKQLVADWADIGAATYVQAVTLGLKVAGITEATALEQIAAVLDAAIRGGSTVAEAAAELAERFGLEATHAMTIVRTNIQSAYAWGHYQQLTDPDVLAELPYWQFHVVEDSKTSSVCKPLAGKIYPAGDNIWNSMYPPNHYNCRTTVSALTAAQAEDEGIATGWPVDKKTGKTAIAAEGFKHNIGTVPLGDIYE